MAKIEEWSVKPDTSDPYIAPELAPVCLYGKCYDHPRQPDGKCVLTSPIVAVDGRRVTTKSGTVYELGRIDPKYRAWLREHRPGWDWRKPIMAKEAAS